jgi:hypothetical protein
MHPGISIHKIPVKAGAMGPVFTLGMVTIALTLPEARWFLAISLPAGVVVGIILRFTSRD